MYKRSEKKQVRYSLKQLAGGLFYHLKYKKYEDITVTDICRKAHVSRRTYYRNCECKDDLIIYSTDHLVSELLGSVDFRETDPFKLYAGFFRYWKEHSVFLKLLYDNSLFDMFLREFIEVCNESMRYPLQEASLNNTDNKELIRRYSNAFIVGGIGQMLKEWAAEDFKSSAEDLAGSILFLAPSDGSSKGSDC